MRQPIILIIYNTALFVSAAIMFALQPMVGKMLLPLVGGTPAGWVVTLAFFQLMLLVGYFVAHALSHLPARLHGAIYILLMCSGWLMLPIRVDATDLDHPGAGDIFALLARSIALPFIALSATSSTLQRLFGTTGHKLAPDPYFLYAASNLGSFAGLIFYPSFMEAHWGLMEQAEKWRYAFAGLIALAVGCLIFARKEPRVAAKTSGSSAIPGQRLRWMLLAFFPSALLSAVTAHITTDVFSAPLIWILPLAVYLATFVVAFARRSLFSMQDIARWHRIVVPLAVVLTCVYNLNIRVSVYAMGCHIFAFGIAALACHTLLAKSRPGDTRQLTDFYLMMAIGGAAGGLLNAFIFPVMLDRLIEYPVLMALSLVMLPDFRGRLNLQGKMFSGFFAFAAFMYFVFVMSNGSFLRADSVGQLNHNMLTADLIVLTLAVILSTNVRLACFGTLALLLVSELVVPRDIVSTARNFYGVIKVFDRPQVIAGKERVVRFMYHGTTTHGLQITGPDYEKMPTAYFWGGGPVGDIFALYNPKNVAVVGLGAGTMNCFSRPDNQFTFFEIDDAVQRVAEREFTFLKACQGKRPPKIIIGDGRIELDKQSGEKYDLIALDAFSSDTIPAHLLTLEAVKTYRSRLSDGGMLIFNLSNRYFTLANPLMRVAQELNLKTRFVLDIPPPDAPQGSPSIWLALAPQGVSLSPLEDYGWVELAPPADEELWTDDFTNLLSSLTFHPALAPARKPVDEAR